MPYLVVDTAEKLCYYLIAFMSNPNGRGGIFFADEESPSFAGQGAGEIPVEATLRKVQQK